MRSATFFTLAITTSILASCSSDSSTSNPNADDAGHGGSGAAGHSGGSVVAGHGGSTTAGHGGSATAGHAGAGGAIVHGGSAGASVTAGSAGSSGKMAAGGPSAGSSGANVGGSDDGGAGGTTSGGAGMSAMAGAPAAGSGGSEVGGSGGAGAVAAAVLAYPVTCPAPGFGNTNTTAPVVVDGTDGTVIDGVNITNPDGPCISIKNGASHVTIKNSVIGPCMGAGVEISGASDVVVENDWISQTGGNAVDAFQVTGLTVDGSCIEHVMSGVYIDTGTAVVIEHNAVKNVQGPFPRGQLTQFNNVSGPGNRVRCNVGDNVAGESNPEDEINIYQSNGTSDSPILIEGNRLRGGGPSKTGGGMMIGDGGQSSWSTLRANVLVNPGQYGVSISSGTNMVMDGNQVFAISQSFTNVGAYVWNQYDSACGPVTVTNNQVDYTNASGEKNGFFNGSQDPSDASFPKCDNTTIAKDNDWNATLSDDIINAVPSVCP